MRYSAYATLPAPSLSILAPSASNVLWNQFAWLARNRVCAALGRGIQKGTLEVSDSSGTSFFGNQLLNKGARKAVIKVHDDKFWVRIFLSYDIGFSEAYMAGDFESPDLKEVLNLYIDNMQTLGSLSSPFYRLTSSIDVLLARFFNHSLSKAVENAAGYDASNDLYKAFLSREMQYSCPIWSDHEGGVRGDLEGRRSPGDLEAAQARKIRHVLKKARLRPGDRLLEIGSGWGSVAIAAARMGCTVDTLTLSMEQKVLADERIKREGLESRVRVHFMDYRDMPANYEKAFDACISIEMLEAVGVKFMATYLSKIDWALKDDRAAVVLTSTTYPESTHTPYQGNDFVRKYHWPNGVSPSPSSLLHDFHSTLPRRFCLDSIEDYGIHYPRCLREWGRRLEANWSVDLVTSLQARYPELHDVKKLEMFRRKWFYMFVYMEVAYSRAWLSCHCWTLVRPGHTAASCA